MEPIPLETWKSFERSAPRRRLTLLVNSLGEAYLGQLSRMLGIRPTRVLALLYGKPPSYSVELGVHTLGLVEEIPVARGRAWRITTRGRRKCRSWTSSRARRIAQELPGAAKAPADAPSTTTWSFRVEG